MFLRNAYSSVAGLFLLGLTSCASLPDRLGSPDPVYAIEITRGSVPNDEYYKDFSAGLLIQYTDSTGKVVEDSFYVKSGMNFLGFPKGTSAITVKQIYGRKKSEINPKTMSFIQVLNWVIRVPAEGTIVLVPSRFRFDEKVVASPTSSSGAHSIVLKETRYTAAEVDAVSKKWNQELTKRSWTALQVLELPPAQQALP